MRAGVVSILEAEPDISVVAEMSVGGDLDALIKRCAPNVVVSGHAAVLDPGGWLHGSKSVSADLPVVLMCDSIAAELDDAVRLGVRGFVLRSDARTQLVHAVREVVAGNAYLAPSVAGYVLDQLGARLPAVDPWVNRGFELLTTREREILRMIATGLTTAEVAKVLHRSQATIKSHISHLLTKLGVQDRAQAIALAYQVGLISVSDTTWKKELGE